MIVVHVQWPTVCAGFAVEMSFILCKGKKISLSFGDDDNRYCSQQVWMVSGGTKLVSVKLPLRNKPIMKKHRLEFFSFTELPIYFIVSKLSQCITAFHGCSLMVSYGASDALVAEMINQGIVCVFARESLSNLCSPLCLSTCLFVSLSKMLQ